MAAFMDNGAKETNAPKKRESARKNWIGTINNWTQEQYDRLVELYEKEQLLSYLIIGKEVGKQGTPHLQIYFQLKKPQRLTTLKKTIGYNWHLEGARGTGEQCRDYCMKDGDYQEWGRLKSSGKTDLGEMVDKIIDNQWCEARAYKEFRSSYVHHKRKIDQMCLAIRREGFRGMKAKEYADVELRDWQRMIWQDIDNYQIENKRDRLVNWVVDREGNKGKTWMAGLLEHKKGAFVVKNGKSADISYAYDYEDVVVFDLSRTCLEHINYEVIENMKDGRLFSSKYESCVKIFPSPYVIVFANCEPNYDKLSKDRWNLIDLDNVTFN